MDRSYIPISYKIDDLPLIIYILKDENPIKEIIHSEEEIKAKINQLYTKNKDLIRGNYHVVFVWCLEKKIMFDVWIHHMENFANSGPLQECVNFKEFDVCKDVGISSGDTLMILGREEELRRTCTSLDAYLNRMVLTPNFSTDFKPIERF